MGRLDPNQHVSLQIAMSEDVQSLALALAKSVVFDQLPAYGQRERDIAVLDILSR
jgi:hypothetical protein